MNTKEKNALIIPLVLALIPCLVTVFIANIKIYTTDTTLFMILGKNGVLLLVLASLIYYFLNYNSEIIKKKQKLMLYVTIYTVTIIPTLFMIDINYLIMPIMVAGMLISALLDTRLGIVTNLFIVLIVAVAGNFNVNFILFYTISGTLATLLILKAKERTMIFYIALYMIIINLTIIILVNLALYGNIKHIEFLDYLFAVLNGAFTVILTVGSLPLWETIFDINTPFKLLEFTNSDQKLLQRLLVEAPGTYHHSQLVSSLAETAAGDIGGNSLLAKLGGLYHDIGKLKDPIYFIENQDGDNPHDDISNDSSAKIIVNHVEDGLKIANEYKLPKPVKNIIKQHHGDTTVKYFYHKAKEENMYSIDEKDYKYTGPKPQSNEAAIVMLADCVEAYIRSIDESKITTDTLKEAINKIINLKFEEDQLGECDLKIKDLSVIANSFLKVYKGKYHERIKYPSTK